ncbi:MAG TPA: hypothetical protein PLW68_16080 [Casimicrobiaceae bacterium]|nr:hypothetical protein [Casimicrobiaceae bacterium]
MQPIVAAIFAVRAGRRGARDGNSLFYRAVLGDPACRRERLQEAWKHIGKVFILAVIIDAAYQFIVEHLVYPSEALMVGLILAVFPDLVSRGIVNRVLRNTVRREAKEYP